MVIKSEKIIYLTEKIDDISSINSILSGSSKYLDDIIEFLEKRNFSEKAVRKFRFINLNSIKNEGLYETLKENDYDNNVYFIIVRDLPNRTDEDKIKLLQHVKKYCDEDIYGIITNDCILKYKTVEEQIMLIDMTHELLKKYSGKVSYDEIEYFIREINILEYRTVEEQIMLIDKYCELKIKNKETKSCAFTKNIHILQNRDVLGQIKIMENVDILDNEHSEKIAKSITVLTNSDIETQLKLMEKVKELNNPKATYLADSKMILNNRTVKEHIELMEATVSIDNIYAYKLAINSTLLENMSNKDQIRIMKAASNLNNEYSYIIGYYDLKNRTLCERIELMEKAKELNNERMVMDLIANIYVCESLSFKKQIEFIDKVQKLEGVKSYNFSDIVHDKELLKTKKVDELIEMISKTIKPVIEKTTEEEKKEESKYQCSLEIFRTSGELKEYLINLKQDVIEIKEHASIYTLSLQNKE